MAWLNPVTEFEEIYTTKFEEVRRKLQVVVHSHDLSEDITQDAFVKAFRLRHTYKAIAPPEHWIYKIGRNLALDHLRNSNRRFEILIRYHAPETTPSDDSKVEDRLQIEDFLKLLSPKQLIVIELYYFYGMTDPAIAIKLERSLNSIIHIRHNALRKMRHQCGKLKDGML